MTTIPECVPNMTFVDVTQLALTPSDVNKRVGNPLIRLYLNKGGLSSYSVSDSVSDMYQWYAPEVFNTSNLYVTTALYQASK